LASLYAWKSILAVGEGEHPLNLSVYRNILKISVVGCDQDLGLEDRAFEDYSESSSDFEHQKVR
jgi:hypothetical protein